MPPPRSCRASGLPDTTVTSRPCRTTVATRIGRSALSRDAQDVDLVLPLSVWERTTVREADGREHKLPTYPQHLLCDETGQYPAELNTWDCEVLKAELQRPGLLGWYRNPSRPTQDSLGVAYVEAGETKTVRPGFLFFTDAGDGTVVVDIVDPHGDHFADSLPKLVGLAVYAERHAGVFRRIIAVAEVGGDLRALELTQADVRATIQSADSARSLYEGPLARDFI